MYKATNIDTDKALQAIENIQCKKMEESERERYALRKYYEGIDKGLELAKGIFTALITKKKNPKPLTSKSGTRIMSIQLRKCAREWRSLKMRLKKRKKQNDNERY